jgi:uncharacterized Zn-binding protein involved in type VI secretion/flagellum-specific peptidoglycan hydrolase FlgJ
MGQPAARISDNHICPMITPGMPPIPHVGGPVTGPGVPTVLIGGMPAAVVGDMCMCIGPPDSIVKGSSGVFIGGKPAARMGDSTTHGGMIIGGLLTVLIGDAGEGKVNQQNAGKDLIDKKNPNVISYKTALNLPRGQFYNKMGSAAVAAINNLNSTNQFKSLYVIAQYRMENGFNLDPPGNNPFNIKGKGDAGQVSYLTTEYVKDKPQKMEQSFASYSTIEKGFEGYFDLLNKNFPTAYNALSDNSKNVSDFANGLMNGTMGAYATDPNYADNMKTMLKGVTKDFEKDINNQLNQNNLTINTNNNVLSSEQYTKQQKIDATSSNADLNDSNTALNNELNELNNFKKNEGLEN